MARFGRMERPLVQLRRDSGKQSGRARTVDVSLKGALPPGWKVYTEREEHTEGRNRGRHFVSCSLWSNKSPSLSLSLSISRCNNDGAGLSRPTSSSPSQPKLYSSNVNINETNELFVMSVMTLDCSRKQANGQLSPDSTRCRCHDSTTGHRQPAACYYIVSMNVYISRTLAMRYASFVDHRDTFAVPF